MFLEKTFYNRDDVSLAGFRVFGFVGARGVIFLINGTLSRNTYGTVAQLIYIKRG